MKINWFSPLLPDHSDIANFTERLRGELQKRFKTRFFTEQGSRFLEPTAGTSYPGGLGPCPLELVLSLNADDLPIYNLGNNPTFFAQTWFLNQLKPGVVILHDVKLHHFFEGIYRGRLHDQTRYLDVLQTWHGSQGRLAGAAFCRGQCSISYMAEHFPMTSWAVGNALGVIVHTPYAYEAVRKVTSTPVWLIPLPYDAPVSRRSTPLADVPADRRTSFPPGRRRKLAIFGYLNHNRRIIEFLHALATMPERELFEVHILGTVFHAAEVAAAVDLLGLRERVMFYGYVTDEELETVLGETDLAINLRYPTMGEASGSQLRIWDHALPSLVTRSEGYASMPARCVFFVRPEHERRDIQRWLRLLIRRPDIFREKGRRGRQWLLDHHLPEMYVDALEPICRQADRLRSRSNQLYLADRVGRASTAWAHAVPSAERDRSYAKHIAEAV